MVDARPPPPPQQPSLSLRSRIHSREQRTAAFCCCLLLLLLLLLLLPFSSSSSKPRQNMHSKRKRTLEPSSRPDGALPPPPSLEPPATCAGASARPPSLSAAGVRSHTQKHRTARFMSARESWDMSARSRCTATRLYSNRSARGPRAGSGRVVGFERGHWLKDFPLLFLSSVPLAHILHHDYLARRPNRGHNLPIEHTSSNFS